MKKVVVGFGKISFMLMMAILAVGIYSNAVVNAAPVKYRSGYAIAQEAKKHLGQLYSSTYRSGPTTFDCSGLAKYVYNQCGVPLSETTFTQVNDGVRIARGTEKPGDLVFFIGEQGTSTSPGHVGIYIGNNQYIHAYEENKPIVIANMAYARDYVCSVRIDGVIDEFTFDPIFYANNYPDLRAAIGYNADALYEHWINYGIVEGRCASSMLDVRYYINNNNDLRSAFGTNYLAAFRHFISNGITEPRKLSPILDIRYYIANNAGLQQFSSYNALEHFKYYGINEPRATSPSFFVVAYRNKNADLDALYGNNYKAYFEHYVAYGYSEGRICL